MLITSGGTFLDSKGNEVKALAMKAPAPTTSGATSNVTPLTSLVAANPSLKAKLDALGGDGWNAGGNPPQYHNMDIHINGSLYGNLTMITGSGPDI